MTINENQQGCCPVCKSEEIVHQNDDITEWKCGRCQVWFEKPETNKENNHADRT